MNYDKVVKHSLSKENELDFLRCKVKILTSLEIQNKELSKMYDDLLIENERCKELQRDNDILVDCMEKLDDKLEATEKENERLKEINEAIQKSKYLWQDESERLHKENAQLKQLKWWQIWK